MLKILHFWIAAFVLMVLNQARRKWTELNEFSFPNESMTLHQFLGMANFYRKLVPRFIDKIFPLIECIRVDPKSKDLTQKREDAEHNCFPYPSSKVNNFHLVKDSSNYAAGSALNQIVVDQPIPTGLFSKKFSLTQQKYSSFDTELLIAYLSVLHFKHQM